jgi:DNA mismatch endonuclease (patch repair protein)
MRAVRQRATEAERALAEELRRRRRVFETNVSLEGIGRRRMDFVFRRARLVVLVDGCFWHVCPIHASWPKSNAAWWREKLEANRRRDRDTDAKLAQAGWSVVRIWEHEAAVEAVDRVVEALQRPRDERPT